MKESGARLIRELDLSVSTEIENFERAFYEGFSHATHNRLVRRLWDWDHDARRLRTRIPYADQRAWTLLSASGAISAAVSVNIRLSTLQSSAYGFALPPDLAAEAAAGRVCEFLTFFAVGGDHSLSGKHALFKTLLEALRAANFTHAVGTTAPKALPMYRYLGVNILGEAQIEGETRYFLDFEADTRPAGNRPAGARILTSTQTPRSLSR